MALSDPLSILASPLTIITRIDEASDIESIIGIVREHQAERIIVGMPRSLHGNIGKQAEKVLAFVRDLKEHSEVPVETRDERLSTVAARRLIRDAGNKKAKYDDAAAAAIILQGYLDESL